MLCLGCLDRYSFSNLVSTVRPSLVFARPVFSLQSNGLFAILVLQSSFPSKFSLLCIVVRYLVARLWVVLLDLSLFRSSSQTTSALSSKILSCLIYVNLHHTSFTSWLHPMSMSRYHLHSFIGALVRSCACVNSAVFDEVAFIWFRSSCQCSVSAIALHLVSSPVFL